LRPERRAELAVFREACNRRLLEGGFVCRTSQPQTAIASWFTEDATFWLARGPEPVGRTLKGRETIRKTLADRFKVIPDMRWDHKEYIYAGNRAISVWTVRGKGADGEDLNYQGCDIYTFRGGKISAKDTYWKIVETKDRL
jgi:taurine dehydrogenase small subunit